MDLETSLDLKSLFASGVTPKQIEGLEMILLPENFDAKFDDQYDAQDSITLSKLLKAEGVKCANSFDLGFDLPTKERRSNDIWLGQLYILNDVILPIVTGVIGSVLASLITDWKNRKDLREPVGNVHTDITIISKEGKKEIHYTGDPETLMKILKAIDNGKKKKK
ncbi:hypothetical protein AAEO56_06560 [Flavobacterium sp. DGU11]|uniref:Uncharacterized protein n=1 Tax=Flavobacterium arundinis TaxID=3139143 RepID=A0ABU9HUT6_9FLAO